MQKSDFNKTFRVFLKNSFYLTISVTVVYLILFFTIPLKYLSPALPWMIIFFFVFTVLSFYFLLKKKKRKLSGFINSYLILTTVKLLFFLMIIIIYSLINKEDAVNFIIGFFILYLIFTSFETIQILKVQRRIK